MMRYVFIFIQSLIAVMLTDIGFAQTGSSHAENSDSIQQRIIFIGDAGELDEQQHRVITQAVTYILPGKTTVVYLGDNIYPTGMGLPGSNEEKRTQDILRGQYQPMRSAGAPVYFLPGNHDWDRMGKQGLEKIKAQWTFLEDQHDSLLHLLPPDGCPGPVEVNLSDHLVIIIFDSEWWLFPHDKTNGEADCDCNTKDEVITRLEDIFYRNRYKTILLADHHPFLSYGHHGGHYGFKDNVFPLTAAYKNLYVPLPVVGSLYPLLRKFLANPEDGDHPLYKDMVKRINSVFDTFPNLVHVSGHDHGMQFIKKKKEVQVVSGAGAKQAFTRKGKYSLFSKTLPGFVVADEKLNNSLCFTYYTKTDGDSALKNDFVYTLPFVSVQQEEQAVIDSLNKDSVTVSAHAQYDSVTGFHRWLLGENYRREWALLTTMPVLKISEFRGGLTPTGRGGGHQSVSLRLKDKDGKEWVLRSVNKFPQVLLPEALRETFAADAVKDAMSAQHPYSALIVPPIADAVKVPHTNPVIGYVAPDKKLGIYNKAFAGTVNLLEEREPLGKSDNTDKMMKHLTDDNDNNVDSATFLRARLLDVLINDWDRHSDQWRFAPQQNKWGGETYIPVPRDRDQVFYVNQGILPRYSTRPWLLFFMQDFQKIRNINDFFWESRDLNGRLLVGVSDSEWTNTTKKFVTDVTDSVLETALRRLPQSAYQLRHNALLKTLQNRRAALPEEMKTYYRFLNRIVDIQTSDKNELVELKDSAGKGLLVNIHKLNKEGEQEESLFCKVFDPSVTRELRIYINKGNDSVVIHSASRNIRVRIIGKKGNKVYDVEQAPRRLDIYSKPDNVTFTGNDAGKVRRHLSNNSLNTAFVPTDLYNKLKPLLEAGYNYDDGILIGAGLRYTRKGFRKTPWASVQQVIASHAFATNAFHIRYQGEWKDVIGKADIVVNADAFAPDNKQNFFGRGNETQFIKVADYKSYYRARFDLYTASALLRWGGKTNISIGPAAQLYQFEADDNKGRFISNTSLLNSYDSSTLANAKAHAGIVIKMIGDMRDRTLFTTSGAYVNITLQSYAGLNSYSKPFTQLIPSVSLYHNLNGKKSIVVADRIGGGISWGKTTFYQSLFLDGKDNLMGYRQYRFAGQYSLYNNFEVRIKLLNINGYLLPGELGMIGLYDIGRVWEKDDTSHKWHNGTGGGFYFAPVRVAIIRFIASYSVEGWYPYVSLGFRF